MAKLSRCANFCFQRLHIYYKTGWLLSNLQSSTLQQQMQSSTGVGWSSDEHLLAWAWCNTSSEFIIGIDTNPKWFLHNPLGNWSDFWWFRALKPACDQLKVARNSFHSTVFWFSLVKILVKYKLVSPSVTQALQGHSHHRGFRCTSDFDL